MQADRDHLVKFVFPQLRRLCETRGVTWGEVDLRWGVTDEEKAEGKVLPICLEEIRRCRPYFIGLLGERYGWVPESISSELLEKEPWLREQFTRNTSVTELEILHGVLRDPAMAGQSYFYFRDPKYSVAQPEDQQAGFISESTEAAGRLSQLKQRIRASGLPVRENYASPEALGALVLADFTAVIERRFPHGSVPDPLLREALDHAAYARSRRRFHVVRPDYLSRLDAHAEGDGGEPLVVTGESGWGKSALLAEWVARCRQRHPHALIIEHYVGASPASADWMAMLRRILGEFKQTFGSEEAIPARPADLRQAFPDWLHMAAAATQQRSGAFPSKIVIVIDGLDQLEDRDGALDLIWLPPLLSGHVRMIVSTLPGRALDEAAKRRWPTLTVNRLSADERRALVRRFLADHGRNLSPSHFNRIVDALPAGNPLYLTVLLDELRQCGAHERLGERIEHYLAAADPYQLYGLVLARWEGDFSGSDQLVRNSLTLLWAARRGLSEAELLDLLGTAAGPLSRARWTPLAYALENNLTQRIGLLSFSHAYLTEAVRTRYIKSPDEETAAHRRLADYFTAGHDDEPGKQPDTMPDPATRSGREQRNFRRLVELPWQLAKATEWERLSAFLTSPRWFELLFHADFEVDLNYYWKVLGGRIDLCAAYHAAIDRFAAAHPAPDALAAFIHGVARFLARQTHFTQAERLYVRALQTTGPAGSDAIKSNLAETQLALGRAGEAERIYREICQHTRRPHADPVLRSIQLSNLANAIRQQGQAQEAVRLLQEAIALLEPHAGTAAPTLATNLVNLGAVLHEMDANEESVAACRRALDVCEHHLGARHLLTGRALAGLALGYQQLERSAEAEPLYRRALVIYEESGPQNDGALLQTYHNLGWLLTLAGKPDAAIDLLARTRPALRRGGTSSVQERKAIFELFSALLFKAGRLDEVAALAEEVFTGSLAESPDGAVLLRNAMMLMKLTQRTNLGFTGRICMRAVGIMERIDGDAKTPHLIELLEALAKISFATNDEELAEDACWRILELTQKHYGLAHPRYTEFRDHFVHHFEMTGRPDSARRVMDYRASRDER